MKHLLSIEEHYAGFPEIKREKVLELLQWIEKQPHLPNLTEHEALTFFSVCNCNMEAAQKLIDVNMTCRTKYTEFFDDYDVETPRMLKAFDTVGLYLLPKRSPDGCAVYVGKLISPDAKNFNFIDTLKVYFIGQDLILHEAGVIKDCILVLDFTDATFAHISKAGIMQLKKLLYYLQEAIPIHLKSVHFINIASFVNKLLTLISPFLGQVARENLHVHSDIETLYNFVPQEILPEELGGSEPHSKVLCEKFYQHIRENRLELMEYNSSRRITEKLRPTQVRKSWNIFGFRKS